MEMMMVKSEANMGKRRVRVSNIADGENPIARCAKRRRRQPAVVARSSDDQQQQADQTSATAATTYLSCLYLIIGTQEEAARAYDIAAIEYRGINAVTNFDLSTYIRWLKPGSDTPIAAVAAAPEPPTLMEPLMMPYSINQEVFFSNCT